MWSSVHPYTALYICTPWYMLFAGLPVWGRGGTSVADGAGPLCGHGARTRVWRGGHRPLWQGHIRTTQPGTLKRLLRYPYTSAYRLTSGRRNDSHSLRHYFCRAMHQIGYDINRRVVAEDCIIWLKSGSFLYNLSYYTINFPRLRIFLRLAAISQKFFYMFKTLRLPAIPYDL